MPASNFTIHENTEYEGINIHSDHYIEIEDNEFKGFKFALGKIEYEGEDEEGFARVKFDYELYEAPDQYTFSETPEQRDAFEKVVAEILDKILVDMTETAKETNETRNTDSEHTDTQRVVPATDDPTP